MPDCDLPAEFGVGFGDQDEEVCYAHVGQQVQAFVEEFEIEDETIVVAVLA